MDDKYDIRLVDPELREGLELFPQSAPTLHTLEAFRALASQPLLPTRPLPTLSEVHLTLPRLVGEGNVDIIVCRPADMRPLPAV